MESAEPAASRSGTTDDKKPTRRFDGRRRREVDQACVLAKKHDAYSVEIHGVRIVFRHAPKPSRNPREEQVSSSQTMRRSEQPASSTTSRGTQAPNSDQRRSARRMDKFLLRKSTQQEQPTPSTKALTSTAADPPQAARSMLNGECAEPMDAESTQRGKKRVASETPATPKSAAADAAAQTPQPPPQPQRQGAVETTAPPAEQPRKQSLSPKRRQTSPGRTKQTAGESPAKPQPAQQHHAKEVRIH